MIHLEPMTALAVLPAAAYLVGSTPFGVIIARAHGIDLRKAGSGNVGATNVGRVVGHKWGYLCFLLDMAKGLLPALAAVLLTPDYDPAVGPSYAHQAVWLGAGLGAILGHIFSFWLGFRGGKGVATALGVVLGIWPYFTYAGLAAFALWIGVTLVSRYISLASMVAAGGFVGLFHLFGWLLGWTMSQLWPLTAFASLMCLLIIFRHRTNIRRLIAGTEPKIGTKKAIRH